MTLLLPYSNPFGDALQASQSKSRRNGKVARLPASFREQINHMIDDGLPYKAIIEKLGEAGKHLNEDNLCSWRFGGYQDYLKARALNERAQTQIETAAAVIRESGDADPAHAQRACQQIALLQYLDVLLEHGDEIARDSLKKNPAKLITLMNSICNLSNSELAIEKRDARMATARVSIDAHAPGCSEPNRTLKNNFPDSRAVKSVNKRSTWNVAGNLSEAIS